MAPRPPTTVCAIHGVTDDDVGAVTSLGDEVFVVFFNNYQRIEVYHHTMHLQMLKTLSVPGLGYCCWGLAACKLYNCIYASDWSNDRVHRVNLSGSNGVMTWLVAPRPAGLSLTSGHNLLVASQGENKLQEFTTHGILLRNIALFQNTPVLQVMQAIQLPGDLFMITHLGAEHAVSATSACSRRLAVFGERYGGSQQLNRPAGLAVDKDGRALVADWYNNRLLVLAVDNAEWPDSPLQIRCLHTMSVAVEGGLKGPCSLWYDQARKRLYIGECEWGGRRVIVVDNLKDFSATEV